MNCKNLLLLSLLFLGTLFTGNTAHAQTADGCEPNIDFELGDNSYWNYSRGKVAGAAGWTMSACPPDTRPMKDGLHEIQGGSSCLDFYGSFSCVGEGQYSLKLNKDSVNYSAAGCDYHIHVPNTPSASFALIYRYAVVFQDPGHGTTDQPKFDISVVDSATGTTVGCNTFSFVASSVLPGFLTSTLGSGVRYKDWTAGSLDLSSSGGKTMIVSFKAGDCNAGGHWGYGYVDMNCGIFKIQTVGCSGGTAELIAPPGYASYIWTDSATYTSPLGTTQKVTVPVPTITTTYAVILTPYAFYGCTDTLYARLVPSNMVAHPSRDTAFCLGDSVRMWGGVTDILPLTYLWAPASGGGIKCTTCDTTIIKPLVASSPVGTPTRYTITTFNTGGCLNKDTINILTFPKPGAFVGNKIICLGYCTTLTNVVAGGTWTTGSTSIISIADTLKGNICATGGVTGTATVTYSFRGLCPAYTTVTVMPLPTAIIGQTSVCLGYTIPMSDATGTGVWTSSNTTVATIGSSSGVVSGLNTGTTVITYALNPTGCFALKVVTVINVPAPTIGVTTICQFAKATLVNPGGGTWTSSNTSVVTIAPVGLDGEVTGVSPGTATITYTIGSGCYVTSPMTVLLAPGAIKGPTVVCVGSTISLSDSLSGGRWTTSNTFIAIATTPTTNPGDIYGAGPGTATVIFTFPTTCKSSLNILVNPLPGATTGTTSLCQGQNATLSNASGSGTWTSSNTNVATITSPGGVWTASSINTGTSTITFTLATGCQSTTIVTVNPNPAPITGIKTVCTGGATSCLSTTSTGGTWSSGSAIVVVNPTTGCYSGLAPGGTATISYKLGSCYSTTTVTVNVTPGTSTGAMRVCLGGSSTLSNATSGGAWSASNTNISIDAAGNVTSNASGTTTISYTSTSGCSATSVFTVSPLPSVILGGTSICSGATARLSDATVGGTWSSSNTLAVNITPSGGSAGTYTAGTGSAVVTYTVLSTGCITTHTITVGPAPTTILGPSNVCIGATIGLTDAVGGGTWVSTKPLIADIDPYTGILTGKNVGTATITYSLGGSCFQTKVITVLPLPGAITGNLSICIGAAITLSNAVGGGTWTSSMPGIASISGRVVTGNTAGTSTISYGVSTSTCFATAVVTVQPVPDAIAGPSDLCYGATATLTSTSPPATSGPIWSSSSTVVLVNASTGVINGNSPTGGSATITYTASTGCKVTTPVTVNALPAPISGPFVVCEGSTVTLSDVTPGGTWSTASSKVIIVGTTATGAPAVPAGSVGTATISYILPTTCQVTAVMKVNPLPAAITPVPAEVCVGATLAMSDATLGGAWTSSLSTTAIIGSLSGIVTGKAVGCTPIKYTLTTGCQVTATVCVLNTPGVIVGNSSVCVGLSTTLSNGTPAGGTWTSSNASILAITPSTGVATAGTTAGTATITYTISTGCFATQLMTVNPLPSPISGSAALCLTSTLTLTDATPGGTWSSSDPAVAGIVSTGPASAKVTPGGTVGTAIITYSVGCEVYTTVTVSPSPAPIAGGNKLCSGSILPLTNSVGGGTWTSSNASVASVTSTGSTTADVLGTLTGTVAGTATISYSVGGVCFATHNVTVDPIPVISGTTGIVCTGTTVNLSTTIPGGSWTSSNTTIAGVSSTGIVTGKTPGTVNIVNMLSTGCSATQPISVNITPGAITGPAAVCVANVITMSNATPGGTWSSSASGIANVASPSLGEIAGVAAGTATITYSVSGCNNTTRVTVNALPSAIAGVSNLCASTTATLTATPTTGRWTSSNTTIAGINAVSGVLSATTSAGVVNITYTLPTGCMTTKPVTVDPPPANIAGPTLVCETQDVVLTNPGVGTWLSSNIAKATIDAFGKVHGVSAGTSTISFTLTSSGCKTFTTVTVVASPGTIVSSATPICVDPVLPATILSTSVSSPGGIWTSDNTSIATVDPATGSVKAMASGTVLMYYTIGSGCRAMGTIVVEPLSPITGNSVICIGQNTTLLDTTLGGTWMSTAGRVRIGATSGVATGLSTGSDNIVYTTSKGCKATYPVTVSTVPGVIAPPDQLCLGQNHAFTVSAPAPGGTWSSSTANASITTTGVATGVTLGTSVISYTVKGCAAMLPVTVNVLPAVVTGPTDVCIGATVVLSNATLGGTWMTGSRLIATVGSSTGVVTGVNTGVTPVSYIVTATGCYASVNMNVHPNPLPIFGPKRVCVNSDINLTNASPSGTWSSTNTAKATVDAFGKVHGVAAGTATIDYSFSTGCAAKYTVTVDGLPTFSPSTPEVCENATLALAGTPSTGSWISRDPSVAVIGLTSGVVKGIVAGTSQIVFSLPSGCVDSVVVKVNPLPGSISGPSKICVSTTANYNNPTPAGIWSSSNLASATADVSNNGDIIATAVPGNTIVSYTLPATGCAVGVAVTVTPQPSAITGKTDLCLGSNYTFTNTVPGGDWTSVDPSVATVNPVTGVVTAAGIGTTDIQYSMSVGCEVLKTINVIALPTSFTVTGGGAPCAGTGGVAVGLNGSQSGVNYFLYVGGTVATGPVSGTGFPITFGKQGATGTYTAVGVEALSGCSSNMTSSVYVNVIPSVVPTVKVKVGTTGDSLVCNGAATTFSVKTTNDGSAPVYNWDVNGTVVAVTSAPYTYVPANGDVVTFTMLSNAVCATPAKVKDHVEMKVVLPVTPSATLSTYPGDTVCESLPVTFTPTAIYGGTTPSYAWSVNRVTITTGPTFTYVPKNNDVVFATISSNYPCLVSKTGSSNSVKMVVTTPEIPHVSVAAAPGTSVKEGQTVTFTAAVTSAGTSPTYQWFINGIPQKGETSATFKSSVFKVGRKDSVNVEVTSSGACKMTTHQWIYMTAYPVGIKQVNNADASISVLPNPNKGMFTISGTLGTNNDEAVTLELTNLLGQVVYKNNVLAKGGNINEQVTLTNNLANGMYLLNIRSEAANKVFHVVIER